MQEIKTMDFQQILTELKKPFPPEAHKERQLPGGGRWLFIPWQAIRERLDEVCPDWSVTWTSPEYIGELCVITCILKIGGVTRSAPGNAPIQMLSNSGKDMSRGTPIERAVADAFKNAAEAFGVGRYLDDQKFVAGYLKTKGDMRAYKYYIENQEIEVGARGVSKAKPPSMISEAQRKRLWAIARNELKLTDDNVKSILAEFQITSTSEIPTSQYEVIVAKIRNYNLNKQEINW
jgi:hypothetical protein